jgi:hypothetical protein
MVAGERRVGRRAGRWRAERGGRRREGGREGAFLALVFAVRLWRGMLDDNVELAEQIFARARGLCGGGGSTDMQMRDEG